MICYPRLLSDTLKDTGLIKNVRGGIGCQYFDRKESRLSAPEEKRDVIRCLKTLISISLDVTSKPHIWVPTPSKFVNDYVSRIENGTKGCIVEAAITIYGKV